MKTNCNECSVEHAVAYPQGQHEKTFCSQCKRATWTTKDKDSNLVTVGFFPDDHKAYLEGY